MATPTEIRADRHEGLILTIPYSILAKKIDRRIILVVNVLSSVIAMLFMIAIGKSGHLFTCYFAMTQSILNAAC